MDTDNKYELKWMRIDLSKLPVLKIRRGDSLFVVRRVRMMNPHVRSYRNNKFLKPYTFTPTLFIGKEKMPCDFFNICHMILLKKGSGVYDLCAHRDGELKRIWSAFNVSPQIIEQYALFSLPNYGKSYTTTSTDSFIVSCLAE